MGLTLLPVSIVSHFSCSPELFPELIPPPGTMEEPGNSRMWFLSPEAHSYSGETGLLSIAEVIETVLLFRERHPVISFLMSWRAC